MRPERSGRRFVALGEVIWDIFQDERRPGGGPLNFAFHAAQLGHDAWVISRVGCDPGGVELLDRVRHLGLGVEHIQTDPHKPTGNVNVAVSLLGEPTFDITKDAAWDYIEATPGAYDLVRSADVIWYGMLSQRSKQSRGAIRALLAAARSEPRDILIVCEMNLRQRYYSSELIRQSLEYCQILRLNEDEFRVVKGMFGRMNATDREFARELLDTFGMLLVCISRSSRGCELHTPDAEVFSPGFIVDVVDTVGSGRAFTAAMLTKLLQGARFSEVARYANLVGAYVATQPGATPRFSPYVLKQFELELEGGCSVS